MKLMNIQEWLDTVAITKTLSIDDPNNCSFEDDRKEYDIYVSKYDGSYITYIPFDDDDYILTNLAKHEVVEQLTNGVGFSPSENKWYGWTHRGMCSFTIGSKCKKGHCHYIPTDENDFLEEMLEFWSDDYKTNVSAEYSIDEDGRKGVLISWIYNDIVPNKNLHNKISSVFNPFPDNFGRGEWVAETMEDAKQMAIDYNRSIS